MTVLWIVLTVAFAVFEAMTVQLVTLWFAIGSLAALIAALAGGEIWLQIVLFITVSLVCLAVTKPFVKKLTKGKIQRTNADRCIGQTAVVIEDIDNINGHGQVNVKGAVWTARSSQGEKIKEGALVKILAIEGVKLIVEPVSSVQEADREAFSAKN